MKAKPRKTYVRKGVVHVCWKGKLYGKDPDQLPNGIRASELVDVAEWDDASRVNVVASHRDASDETCETWPRRRDLEDGAAPEKKAAGPPIPVSLVLPSGIVPLHGSSCIDPDRDLLAVKDLGNGLFSLSQATADGRGAVAEPWIAKMREFTGSEAPESIEDVKVIGRVGAHAGCPGAGKLRSSPTVSRLKHNKTKLEWNKCAGCGASEAFGDEIEIVAGEEVA